MTDAAGNNPTIADIKFYDAILHPDGAYVVEEFNTVDELANRLRDLIDKDVSVFNFAGVQLKISKPPFRHLLTPWGAKPLFSISEKLEIDESGYLGVDPIHLLDPPQLPAGKQHKMPADDEFFEDNDGTSLGVFDDILPDPDS